MSFESKEGQLQKRLSNVFTPRLDVDGPSASRWNVPDNCVGCGVNLSQKGFKYYGEDGPYCLDVCVPIMEKK